uniref:Uncharacterized protein n=1 Tax=Codium arenicola TaxID=1191365 RepID=A0A2P0QI17_9CHLO|nr:hypothetical protein [Codium arenicola]ARO74372.1 hypothetical protein [Codium arenicola]
MKFNSFLKLEPSICLGVNLHTNLKTKENCGKGHLILKVFKNIPIHLNTSIDLLPPRQKTITLEVYTNLQNTSAYLSQNLKSSGGKPTEELSNLEVISRESECYWSAQPRIDISGNSEYLKTSVNLLHINIPQYIRDRSTYQNLISPPGELNTPVISTTTPFIDKSCVILSVILLV